MALFEQFATHLDPSAFARKLDRQQEEDARLERYHRAWLAYKGELANVLNVEDDDPDDNVLVPYETVVVNKGRSFLFGKGIEFEVDPTEEERIAEEEAALIAQADAENQKNVKRKEREEREDVSRKNAVKPDEAPKEEPPERKPVPKIVQKPKPGEDPEDPDAETEPVVEKKAPDEEPDTVMPDDFRVEETEQQQAQKWLDACWRRNKKKGTLLKLATNGGVFGHAWVKIKPAEPFPRVIVLDPAACSVEWDDEDIEHAVGYEIRWNSFDEDDNPIVRRELHIEEDGGTWTILRQAVKSPGGQWEDTEPPESWPYTWPAVLECQNLPTPNEVYGTSDLEDGVLRMNRAINRLMSNLNRIIRLHAHPKMWMTGVNIELLKEFKDEGMLAFGPDDLTLLPGENAEMGSVEMQNDLSSSIELYSRLKDLFHEVTRLPEVASGKMENVGSLSGTALDILYGPLTELTEDKRCTYGDLLEQLNARLLELGGFGEEREVHNVWPEVKPKDVVAEGTALMQDKQMGVSDRTLLQKRGYDPDLEQEQRQGETERNIENQMMLMDRGLGPGQEEAEEEE